VPLARDLHPEFGYVGFAPRLFRKIGIVLSFIVFGLVACVSVVAVFLAGSDPDPMNAMALAPAEALVGATNATTPASAEARTTQASTQKSDKAEGVSKTAAIKPPCRESSGGQPDDCTFVRAYKPRPALAANERPAIAAVPIGRRDEPAALPLEAPAIGVAAAPQTPEAVATASDPVVPAEVDPVAAAPAPAAVAKKSRPRNTIVHHRRETPTRSSSYRPHDFMSGYARLW
jgi:hypothetical protein